MNKIEKILLIEKEITLEVRRDALKYRVARWYGQAKKWHQKGDTKRALKYWSMCKDAVLDFLIADAEYTAILVFRINTNISYTEIRAIKENSSKIKEEMNFWKVNPDEEIIIYGKVFKPARYKLIQRVKKIMRGGK